MIVSIKQSNYSRKLEKFKELKGRKRNLRLVDNNYLLSKSDAD
jgi:hypothetical protein